MSDRPHPDEPDAEEDLIRRVDVKTHRTARVLGVDDRPALDLTNVDGRVTIALLPRNGSKRSPVHLADLRAAVEALTS